MATKNPQTLRLSRDDAEIILGVFEAMTVTFYPNEKEQKIRTRLEKFVNVGY